MSYSFRPTKSYHIGWSDMRGAGQPSLIALMLLDPTRIAYQEIVYKSSLTEKSKSNRFLFHLYFDSFVLNARALFKRGKKDSLALDINLALIDLALSIIYEPAKREYPPEAIHSCLRIFNHLDIVELEFPNKGTNETAREFLIANRMGQIIYGENNTIPLSMELYAELSTSLKVFGEQFSKFFVVEEQDSDWNRYLP